MSKDNKIIIEGAKLCIKNFSGKSDRFTSEGKRSFGVILPDMETASEYEEAGIPVKYFKPRHEEDSPLPWIKVKVNMNRENPPKIFIDRGGDRKILTEDTISSLDYADIDYAHMELSIYDWEMGGKSGKTLYLSNIICFLNEEDFLSKYDLTDVD